MKKTMTGLLAGVVCASTVMASEQVNFSNFGTVASVNGAAISSDKFERNFEEFMRDNNINIGSIRYPKRLKEYKKELLDMLINAELVWQEANKMEIKASDAEVQQVMTDVRSQFKTQDDFVKTLQGEGYTLESYNEHIFRMVVSRKYLDQLGMAANEINDEAIHDFYVNNPDKFHMPDMAHARHILLKTSSAMSGTEKQAVRVKLEDIQQRLKKGEEFAELAKQFSEDSSASRGGDLGYFPKGVMVGPFEDTVFALKAGEMSDIVETQFGFHIVEVLEQRPAGAVPELQAKDQIRAYLLQQSKRNVVNEEIQRLRAQSKIEIYLSL
ncbi:peptidylprolyl isomerase [Kaarinaea lacus]